MQVFSVTSTTNLSSIIQRKLASQNRGKNTVNVIPTCDQNAVLSITLHRIGL